MTKLRTSLRTSLMSAALLAGVAGIGLAPAFAQTGPAPAAETPSHSGMHHRDHFSMMPGQLVDGRIAFLQAELKITPAQQTQWQQFASVMRQNAQALDQAIASARQHRGAAQNAVDRLSLRAEFAKVHANNEARLATAFRPLYASLSPDQQQVANQLVGHGLGHHGEWRRHA